MSVYAFFKQMKHHYMPQTAQIAGIITVLFGAIICLYLQHIFEHKIIGLSSLTIAIVLGVMIGNSIYPKVEKQLSAGVGYSKGQILRIAIVMYGFKLTLAQLQSFGISAVLIDFLVLIMTFGLTYWLGLRLKMDRQTVILMGAGASICGAAAVIASEPVVRAESHKVSIAVATVVVFGTIAMLLYPVLYHAGWLGQWLPEHYYGLYMGSTIHEVAQVVAAGNAISADIGNIAVVGKMIRVMMLAPFLLVLSFVFSGSNAQAQSNKTAQSAFIQRLKHVNIPWFAFLFIIMVLVNSYIAPPKSISTVLVTIDNILLTMAMFALGMTTHLSAIKKAGVKPLILGAIIFAWLILGGGLINIVVDYLI